MTFVKGQRCYRLQPEWTPKMDSQLLDLIGGSHSYKFMAAKLGKSIDALRKRAKALGHSLDQGTVMLRELSRQTGYDRQQLRRAARALGQHWKRATNRKLLITGEQTIDLINYLRGEKVMRRIHRTKSAVTYECDGVRYHVRKGALVRDGGVPMWEWTVEEADGTLLASSGKTPEGMFHTLREAKAAMLRHLGLDQKR